MPYVLAFNRPAIEPRIERSAYLGLPARFEAFPDWVLALRAELDVPHTLEGLKIGPSGSTRWPRWLRRIRRPAAIPSR